MSLPQDSFVSIGCLAVASEVCRRALRSSCAAAKQVCAPVRNKQSAQLQHCVSAVRCSNTVLSPLLFTLPSSCAGGSRPARTQPQAGAARCGDACAAPGGCCLGTLAGDAPAAPHAAGVDGGEGAVESDAVVALLDGVNNCYCTCYFSRWLIWAVVWLPCFSLPFLLVDFSLSRSMHMP